MPYFFSILLAIQAVFLILLVLVQRGRGGGLAGALGGPGGSSAFGTKAGDAFTRFTIYAVTIWIITCIVAAWWGRNRGDALGGDITPLSNVTAPIGDLGDTPPATSESSTGEPATSESSTSETASSQVGDTGAATEQAPAEAPADSDQE